jgi:bacillithiol biosynthesis deacetylase BshB1
MCRIEKNKMRMTTVMIVAPHPDDAELAMGGTIVRMIESGWEVVVIDLTDGEPTPFGSEEVRREETEEASRILGIKQRRCLGMPNRYLQANLENRRKLAEVIREYQPALLFGPTTPDYHPDHVETARLVEGARFEAKLHKTTMERTPYWVPRHYGYFSTHGTATGRLSFLVDVTDSWDKKIRAIQAYQSQVRNVSATNCVSLLERVEVVCRYLGQCIGSKYAEPFVAYEPIGVKSLKILADFY